MRILALATLLLASSPQGTVEVGKPIAYVVYTDCWNWVAVPGVHPRCYSI
jgi:hypothetical protein